MEWSRFQYDLQYIVLNGFVNKIPLWSIRKMIYKKFGLHMGEEARIGIGTMIICPQNIKIGSRTVINENCVLDGRGGLIIGHDTSISMFTKILSASHKVNSSQFAYYTKKTVIGRCVWTGTGAVILDGTQIGNYAVIGANAVVKGYVGERQIMVGNPARELKKRMVNEKYRLAYKAYFR